MTERLRILLLEEDEDHAQTTQDLLKGQAMDCDYYITSDRKEYLEALEVFNPDIIISDDTFPNFHAVEALEHVLSQATHIPFIIVTDQDSEELAIDLIQAGATDYILKTQMSRLPAIINNILKRKNSADKITRHHERLKYVAGATADIIWELDFQSKRYLIHEGKEKLFGNNRPLDWRLGIEGRYIVEEDRNAVRESFKHARYDPECQYWKMEYRVHSDDHAVLFVKNHASFIRDSSGRALRVIGALTDITSRKKEEAEQLRQQREDQLQVAAIIIDAQETERNVIGKELHDNINQTLVGTNLMLSMIRDHPEKLEELIGTCMESLRMAIAENRNISHNLLRPDLPGEGLIAEISNVMSVQFTNAGIRMTIDDTKFNPELLSLERQLAIYRIAQEQCRNVIRHSAATKVKIELITENSIFRMTIEDDGVGADLRDVMAGKGLRSIKARLAIFFGVADVITSEGNGFILKVRMPLA